MYRAIAASSVRRPTIPTFARLPRALAYEGAGAISDAHKEWQKFEKSVADHPRAWPAGQTERSALVWSHMGSESAAIPDFDNPALPPVLRNHPARPQPLKPGPEECFGEEPQARPRCAGNARETRHALPRFAQVQESRTGRSPSLGALPRSRSDHRSPGRSAWRPATIRRAFRSFDTHALNPLDRRLRRRLSTAHIFSAPRAHAEAGRFDEARAEYKASLALSRQERQDFGVLQMGRVRVQGRRHRPRRGTAGQGARRCRQPIGRRLQHVDRGDSPETDQDRKALQR